MSKPNLSTDSLMRTARAVLLAAGGLFVWLANITWPVPIGEGVDASWQFVLMFARTARLQFGTEIVFTYGPWGYLSTVFCHPDFFWDHLVWELVFKGSLSGLAVFLAARLPWWRAAFLLAAFAFALPMFADTAFCFLIAILLWHQARADSHVKLLGVAAGFVLAFLSLQKFTYLATAGAGLIGVTCILWTRGKMQAALWLLGSWLLGLAIGWMLAGQSLANFPVFLLHSASQSSAYQGAMGLDETPAVFWCGIITLACFGFTATAEGLHRDGWSLASRVLLGGLALGLVFLVWKQSFLRADGHVLGLFLFALFVGCSLRTWSGLVLASAGLLGFFISDPALFRNMGGLLRLHVNDSIVAIRSPMELHSRFQQQTRAMAAANQLPQVKARVGAAPIDIFGHDQVLAFWNDLNYRPRPAFQGYPVASGALAQINSEYYDSERSPDFVLARLDSIDGRLPSMDDARTLLHLTRNFTLEMEERGWLLLRRVRRDRQESMAFAASQQMPLRAMTPVHLPSPGPVWAELHLRESVWGRLRAFVYKPKMTTIVIESDAGPQRFRFVPQASAGGFLLQPLLTSTSDLRDFLNRRPQPAIKALGLDLPEEDLGYFNGPIEIKLAPIPFVP